CLTADLGQTAEGSKLRVGAAFSSRYLCIFSSNKLVTFLLKRLVGAFSYKAARVSHSMWKTDLESFS
ncbi:MAG: hypothetical protein FWD43_04800, partial [Coriobacteriia bacterium]|nr:hypothetical protein [Coriobacteriia bacterium]